MTFYRLVNSFNITVFFTLLALAANAAAEPKPPPAQVLTPQDLTRHFGPYTVHYNLFNSTLISPDNAQKYGLIRAHNRVLLNVSLSKHNQGKTTLGLPGTVTGTASNLIAQQQVLDFKKIAEGKVTYFIAAIKHTNAEMYNIALKIKPADSQKTFKIKFSRKLYNDANNHD